MTLTFRFRQIILPLLCLLPIAMADEAAPAPATSAAVPSPTLLSRINGLFDIELPRLDPPGTYKLIFHPHIGDFFNRSYFRTDIGLRWALNDRFGMNAEVGTFAKHGLRAGNSGYGIGQVRAGFKHVFTAWPKAEYQTSIGFDTLLAVGHPPIDMTDGLRHYTPNVAVQYRPPGHPKWTTFGGANIDLVASAGIPAIPLVNTPRDDSLSVTGGAIYDMGQLKWTLQATYTTTALVGDKTQNFYSIHPSVIWYVPKRYAAITKTQWIIGVGANATWGPDGFHLASSSRLRAEITFRQVMQKIRETTKRE